jgi:hypothetical protein
MGMFRSFQKILNEKVRTRMEVGETKELVELIQAGQVGFDSVGM